MINFKYIARFILWTAWDIWNKWADVFPFSFNKERGGTSFIMGNIAMHQQTQQKRIKDWTDIFFSTNAGYVAVTDFKEQTFFGSRDIKHVKRVTEGQPDQYISINAFKGWHEVGTPTRQTKDIKQIRNIAIDIDQYELGLTKEQAINEIQALMVRNIIPRPNMITHSNGIQLFFNIDGGASTVNSIAWWTGYITDQFIGKLKHVGADPNAKDLSRVMRVPYSINSRNNSIVTPLIWKVTPYSLQELYKYCKPYDVFKSRKLLKHDKLPYGTTLMNRVNYARLVDLERYIDITGGNLTYKRTIFLFIYAFHQSLHESTKTNLHHKMEGVRKRIYSTDDKPLSDNKFYETINSAYDYAGKFFEYLKENNFKIHDNGADGVIKPYTSENIVKKLGIDKLDDDVQKTFNTIVSKRIRKLKEKDRAEAYRREQGIRPIEKYQEERKQRKQAKIDELKALMKSEPDLSKTAIAKRLGIGRTHLYNLLNGINRESVH